jgi:hypothetical protein
VRGLVPHRHPVAPGAQHPVERRGRRPRGPRASPPPAPRRSGHRRPDRGHADDVGRPHNACGLRAEHHLEPLAGVRPMEARRVISRRSRTRSPGADIARGIDDARASPSMPRQLRDVLTNGLRVRLEGRRVEIEALDGAEPGRCSRSISAVARRVLDRASGFLAQRLAARRLRKSVRSWPEPSRHPGGTERPPRTPRPARAARRGSSSASSASPGGPIAFIVEFRNRRWCACIGRT